MELSVVGNAIAGYCKYCIVVAAAVRRSVHVPVPFVAQVLSFVFARFCQLVRGIVAPCQY
jgi:hypothetical protein